MAGHRCGVRIEASDMLEAGLAQAFSQTLTQRRWLHPMLLVIAALIFLHAHLPARMCPRLRKSQVTHDFWTRAREPNLCHSRNLPPSLNGIKMLFEQQGALQALP